MSTRRVPGSENGDAFIRRCPVCRRDVKARGLVDRKKVHLAATFAGVHLVHFESANPDANPYRCRACGVLLLFDHRCPEHVYEPRVEWTPELSRAYVEVVNAVAKGGSRTVIPWGNETYVQAYNLAKVWGLREDLGAIWGTSAEPAPGGAA